MKFVWPRAFFNHESLTEEMKAMLASLVYSGVRLREDKKERRLDISSEVLAKGICDKMGLSYIAIADIVTALKKIRPCLSEEAAEEGKLIEE